VKYNSVYCLDEGGFMFGLDRVTPVTWYFTPRKVGPSKAYACFSLDHPQCDPAKVNSMPRAVIASFNELRASLSREKS
jgi:hypothetical protein